jgi:transposase
VTAAAVRAAVPKGNLYVDLRTEFGTLYTDQLFADLYPPEGRPVEVAPWRLALVVVMQYMEGLTDRQAADAVRRCMDWKYALSLDLHDPGFDFTLLHDFRERLVAHEAGQRFLDTFLTTCKARGWIKARGTQRTDSTHVLAAMRTLHRLECVLEAMHYALNQLSAADPAWVQQHVPLDWYTRYGLRADQMRLPKESSTISRERSAALPFDAATASIAGLMSRATTRPRSPTKGAASRATMPVLSLSVLDGAL